MNSVNGFGKRLLERPIGFGRFYLSRLRLFSRNVRLFLAAVFMIGMGLAFWQLLFNLYLEAAGHSKEFIGDALSLGNLAVAGAALPIGLLAGRFRLRRLLIGSQFLSCTAFALAILSQSDGGLLAFMTVAFIFQTFARVVSGPFIMRNSTPVERPYIFSTFFLIMLAGGVLGNALGGAIKDALSALGQSPLLSYRTTMLIGIGSSFLGLIPFFFLEETPKAEMPSSPLRLSGLRRLEWPLFARALLPEALLAIGAGLIVQFMNLYFKDVFHCDDRAIGLYMSFQAMAMVGGVLMAPVLAERLGKVRVIVGTQLASLPFMLALAFTGDLSLALAAFILRAALMNMSGPIANTLIMEVCRKEEQNILNSLFTLVWSLSWAVASHIYGRLIGADYTASFLIAVVLYATSSLFYYLFFKGVEQKRKAPETDAVPAQPALS